MVLAYLFDIFSDPAQTKRTIIKNGVWRFIANGTSKIVRLFVIFVVARLVGPEQFGVYSYSLSLASLAFLFADWGMNMLVVKEVSQRSDPARSLSAAVTVNLITTIGSFLAGIGVFLLMDNAIHFSIGLAVMAALAFGNVRDVYVNALIGMQRSRFEFPVLIADVVMLAIGSAALIGFGEMDVFAFCLISALASAASLAVAMYVSRRFLRMPFLRPEYAHIKALFKAGLPMAWFGLVGYVFFSSDQLFIKHYLGFAAVGEYAFATRIIYASMILPGIVASVMLPQFARSVGDTGRFRRIFRLGIWAMIGCSLLFAVPTFLVAKFAIGLILPEYNSAVPYIFGLFLSVVPLYMLIWLDNVIVVVSRQWQNLFVTISAVVINLVLIAVLVPSHGIWGAIIATAGAQYLNLLGTYMVARRGVRILGITGS